MVKALTFLQMFKNQSHHIDIRKVAIELLGIVDLGVSKTWSLHVGQPYLQRQKK